LIVVIVVVVVQETLITAIFNHDDNCHQRVRLFSHTLGSLTLLTQCHPPVSREDTKTIRSAFDMHDENMSPPILYKCH
jgi:hypothetical protein